MPQLSALILILCAAVGACGGDDAPTASDDHDGLGLPDFSATCPGGAGCICTDNDACDSGLCLNTAFGWRCAGTCKGDKGGSACDDGQDTPCRKATCDPNTGVCSLSNLAKGTDCSDGAVCVEATCDGQGACHVKPTCGCTKAADCAAKDDDNLCNGVLYCDKSAAPYTCKTNPATVVTCLSGQDTVCRTSQCQPATGTCALVDKPAKTACDDGEICTAGDHCLGGACVPGTWVCTCASDADCVKSDDGNLCNGTMYCDKAAGACKVNPATVVTCPTADDDLCRARVCDPKTGSCPLIALNAGVGCSDNNPCTTGEACKDGMCKGGTATCPCQIDADCAAHEDGDLCNGLLYCHKASATCQVNPATIVTCPSVDDSQCMKRLCQPKTGACALTPAIEGAHCEDGNPCTASDACKGGKCVAGVSVCACQSQTDCAKFEDGDLCNGTLYCDQAPPEPTCKLNPSTLKSCPSVDDTTCLKNRCQPKTGLCQWQPEVQGAPCDDGVPCTKADHCAAGKCVPGMKTCFCGPGGDCSAYDDGNVCTGAVQCDATTGLCGPKAGSAPNCDDDNDCTLDGCDAKTGCTHKPAAAACSDGDPCTVSDTCVQGVCASGGVANCDDGSTCTLDACVAGKGCQSDGATQNGKACDDGDACTKNTSCAAGQCQGAVPVTCDDGNPCTEDSCAAKAGCTNASVVDGTKCAAGEPCTGPGTCAGGKCGGGVPWLWKSPTPAAGDQFLGIALDGDGVLVAGNTKKLSLDDFRVARFDAKGQEDWSTTAGGGASYANAVVPIAGGAVACGWSQAAGNGDGVLTRLDAKGKATWLYNYGLSSNLEKFEDLSVTPSGFAAAGTIRSIAGGAGGFWLLATDPNGVEQWQKTFDGTGDSLATGLLTVNGALVLVGRSKAPPIGSWDGMAVVATLTGKKTGGWTMGSWASDHFGAIEPLGQGYVVGGMWSSGPPNGSWLVAHDASGAVLWEANLGPGGPGWANTLATTKSAVYLAQGSDVAAVTTTGELRWSRTVEVASSIGAIAADDSGLYIATLAGQVHRMDAFGNASCQTSGPCLTKGPMDCADQNPCTADLCDAAHGGCFHTDFPSGTPCGAKATCDQGVCK